MFVVHLNDGKIVKEENGITWDDVPDGISVIEITTPAGEILTLPKCESYFFSNEAKTYLTIDNLSTASSPPTITASIIGGVIGDKAIYIKIEIGHIHIDWKDKKDLPFIEKTYRKGV